MVSFFKKSFQYILGIFISMSFASGILLFALLERNKVLITKSGNVWLLLHFMNVQFHLVNRACLLP